MSLLSALSGYMLISLAPAAIEDRSFITVKPAILNLVLVCVLSVVRFLWIRSSFTIKGFCPLSSDCCAGAE